MSSGAARHSSVELSRLASEHSFAFLGLHTGQSGATSGDRTCTGRTPAEARQSARTPGSPGRRGVTGRPRAAAAPQTCARRKETRGAAAGPARREDRPRVRTASLRAPRPRVDGLATPGCSRAGRPLRPGAASRRGPLTRGGKMTPRCSTFLPTSDRRRAPSLASRIDPPFAIPAG